MAPFSSLLTVRLFSSAAYVCAISDMTGHFFSTFKTLGFFTEIFHIYSVTFAKHFSQAFLLWLLPP